MEKQLTYKFKNIKRITTKNCSLNVCTLLLGSYGNPNIKEKCQNVKALSKLDHSTKNLFSDESRSFKK